MSSRYNKNFFSRLFSSRIFLLVIGISLIWLAVGLGQESYRKYQLNRQINQLKAEIEQLQDTNQELSNLIDYFQNPSYLEKEARLKLNLKQPGETVVIVPDQELTGTTSSVEETQEIDPSASDSRTRKEFNLWKWWEYFFGEKE